jgi:hypothetical protein
MKRAILVAACALSIATRAQVVSPIATTGYNIDAVAENTTALSTTSQALDGSDYVMYSAAYGSIYSTGNGLPNNGLIASGTRTYQLQSYTANNVLYRTAGQMDTIVLTTPASYAALSILNFATEGAATMNITVRFTDNSTQVFNGLSVPDWFGTGNQVIAGFDRCGRNSGTPNNNTTNPKMFYNDLVISCANRAKLVAKVIVHHAGASARLCVMAVSGVVVPTFSVGITPVSCVGGTNGSATVTPTGGIGPFGFTISTSPVITNSIISNVPTGVYSYTAQDAALCPVLSSFTVTQVLTPQPSLTIASSTTTVCAGKSVTLTASGANTFTWNGVSSPATTVVLPGSTTTYSVSGTTSVNCVRTGTVQITVNQLPVVTLTPPPSSLCTNSGIQTLTASPPGGGFSGGGVNGPTFDPTVGAGNYTITYQYTDANGCVNSSSAAVAVFSLAAPQLVSPGGLCINAAQAQLTISPTGGIFSGAGVGATGLVTPSLAGAGTHTIGYTISSGACTVSSASNYTVFALSPVTFSMSKTFFCKNAANVPLNSNPSTGVYSGPGVSGGFFSPSQAGPGTHTITYSYTDMNSCTTKATVNVTVSTCDGISESGQETLLIFPNPSNGEINISAKKPFAFMLYDAMGRIVVERTAVCGTIITLTELNQGMYLLLSNGKVTRIVIQR